MATSGPLYGRASELSTLREALREAQSGRGQIVLLSGEPGIGKTRLAGAFAEDAQTLGAHVSWGRAWEAGGAPAYWPWIEALRPFAAKVAAIVADVDRERLAPIGRLLPELATPDLLHPGAEPAQERFRLFDATALFLGYAARQSLPVIVLDDLHAADLGTLSLLHFVARGLHAVGVLVVGTYRDAEARQSPDLGGTLAQVAREGREMPLRRLDREVIAEWLAAETSPDQAGSAEDLFQATEGNPFFVAEMMRFARDRGGWHTRSDGRLPDGVRDVIRARLDQLSAQTRDLLEAASILGRTIDLAQAARLADVSLPRARDLAVEAAGADVLVDVGDRTLFSHILMREVLYHEIPAERSARLHAQVGRDLAERYADDEHASLSEAVHHLFAASPIVPADEILAWARRAAARAKKRLAFEEAADILTRAAEHLPPGMDTLRVDLLLELAAAQGVAGQTTRGRATAAEAADIARGLGDARRLAEAALTCGASFLLAVVDSALLNLLEEALAALPDGEKELRARLLARLAAALQPSPDPERPIALARDAIALSESVGEESARLEVLVAATSAMAYFADPRERLPLNEKLVATADRVGARVAALRGLFRLAFDHVELGDMVSADHAIDEFDRRSRTADLPALRWRAPMLRAMRAVMDGRFDEAEYLAGQAESIASRIDDRSAVATFAAHKAGRLWAMRRLDALSAHLPHTIERLGTLGDPIFTRSFRVGILARVGRAEEARSDYEALVWHDPPFRGRPMLVWAADACLALEDRKGATVLLPLLEPFADRRYSWSPLAMITEGPIEDWLTQLRELVGNATPDRPVTAPVKVELIPEGDYWTIRADVTFRLRDLRGLHILSQLLAQPGRPVHATELLAPPGEAGHVEDAGDAIDAQAIAAYRQRLEDLRETLDEAEAFGDIGRASRAREEIEAIESELAYSVGIGGRPRKAAATAEKARVNVRKRLNDAICRIAEHSPNLAKHLRQTIRTGTFCCYEP